VAVSTIKTNKSNFVVNASADILNVLSEGVNAVKIDSGTSLGSYFAPNNLRGIAIRQGVTCVGFVASFDGQNFFIIGNNGHNSWTEATKNS